MRGNLFNNTEFGYSADPPVRRNDNDIMQSTQHKVDPKALFGLPTPGLTPIPYHNRTSMSGVFTGGSMLLDSHTTGRKSDFDLDGEDSRGPEHTSKINATQIKAKRGVDSSERSLN